MKVLLIAPKVTRLFEEAPLGIMYIASVIRKAGHDVKLIDGNLEVLKHELVTIFKNGIPDFIGMTCTTLTYPLVMALADSIGESYPDIPIVIGGVHATIMPETLLENSNIDFCVIGEGEETILKLIEWTEHPKTSSGTPYGIAYKHSNEIIKTPRREPITCIDSIPFPARDLLDKNYFKSHRTTLITVRGCPFNCSYCQPTLRKIFGDKIRRRSTQNVIEEMVEMYDKYNIRYFKFFDDTFTSDREWVFDLMRKIQNTFQNAGKHIKLDCLTRVSVVDLELLREMKKAGFCRINFGVESGSQKILNYYRKGTKVEQAIEAFGLCKEAGIEPHSCLMIGAPEETMDDIKQTRDLIKKMKPASICVSITTPMPHTAMWDDCIQKGIIKEEDWLKVGDYLQKWGVVCQNIPEKELFRLKQVIQRNFWIRHMFNPRNIYNFMRYHDLRSALRDAKYFLWKGDYS